MAVNTLAKIRQDLTSVSGQNLIASMVGRKKDSFTQNLIELVQNNVSLQECTTKSLVATALTATSLGLSLNPNLGRAYAIPYDNTKKKFNKATKKWEVDGEKIMECQFQIGWKGLVELAARSGFYKDINAREVKDGEYLGEDFLTGRPKFSMIKENRENIKTVGYVAYFCIKDPSTGNEFDKAIYWTVDRVKEHAYKFSQTYKSDKDRFDELSHEMGESKAIEYFKPKSTWFKHFDSMALKTVLKKLLNDWGILSVAMERAIRYDQGIGDADGSVRYDDNPEEGNQFMNATVVGDDGKIISGKPSRFSGTSAGIAERLQELNEQEAQIVEENGDQQNTGNGTLFN